MYMSKEEEKIEKNIEAKEFSNKVERFAALNGISVLDSLIHFSSKLDLDPQTVKSMVTRKLRNKLEENASDLNLLKVPEDKPATLPID